MRNTNKGQLGAIAVELLPFFEKDAKRRQKESIKQRDVLGREKPVV
jgi:hypothetical protein